MGNKVKYDLNKFANAFEAAHKGTAELYGWGWFNANREARAAVEALGVDTSDPVIKTVMSVALRAALDKVLLPLVQAAIKDAAVQQPQQEAPGSSDAKDL